MATAHHLAAQDLGGLIASAMELSFAVELYLKVLWIRLGASAPPHHDLWSLFKDLPSTELKRTIEHRYDDANRSAGDTVASFELAILVGPANEEESKRTESTLNAKPLDSSLKAVLRRSRDGFQTWRYLFEQGRSGEVRFFKFEFARLGIIANVVREQGVYSL